MALADRGQGGILGAQACSVKGLLSADAKLWEPYSEGLAEAGHSPTVGVMAGGIQGWATDDPDGDWPTVSEHLAHQLNSYRRHMVEGTDRPPPKPVNLDRVVNADGSGPAAVVHVRNT